MRLHLRSYLSIRGLTAVLALLLLTISPALAERSLQDTSLLSARSPVPLACEDLDRRFGEALSQAAATGKVTQDWEALSLALRQLRVYPFVVPMVYGYDTPDPADPLETILVSGVVVYPLDLKHRTSPAPIPMFGFQHPTQALRKYSPSECATLRTMLKDPEFNVLLGCLIAATGYTVVIADYPGMGIDTTHPQNYCHASLGDAVIGLFDLAIEESGALWAQFFGVPPWNGQVYLMGYSEGGYATLITAKRMQTGYPGVYDIRGVAPLDGPQSLSKTMRDVMLHADASYKEPYFMPFVLQAYDDIYGATIPQMDFLYAVKQEVPGYAGNYAEALRAMLDGSTSGETIDTFMHLVEPYVGPRSILTDAFVEDLEDDQGIVVQTLAANDAYRDWVPEMPVMFFHHVLDDLVPYENSVLALEAFLKGGAEEVGLMPFDAELGKADSIHQEAAPVAYLLGFSWIHFLTTGN